MRQYRRLGATCTRCMLVLHAYAETAMIVSATNVHTANFRARARLDGMARVGTHPTRHLSDGGRLANYPQPGSL